MKGSGFFKQINSTCNISVSIDNLGTFNKSEFENNYNDIYPDKLDLKK